MLPVRLAKCGKAGLAVAGLRRNVSSWCLTAVGPVRVEHRRAESKHRKIERTKVAGRSTGLHLEDAEAESAREARCGPVEYRPEGLGCCRRGSR